MLKPCLMLMLCMVYVICDEHTLPDPSHASTDELELMSREMRKRELSKMAADAEDLKVELASPSTSIERRVEAAAKMEKIYNTIRLELYKSAFSESLRMILANTNKLAQKSCSDMGVHLDQPKDKYVVENCKRALTMVWNMLLADRVESKNTLLSKVKTQVRTYLSHRVNATKPSTVAN